MYIFLDIDGVLNRESDWKHPYTLNQECIDAFLSFCHQYQKKKKDNISLVLISTWRVGMKDKFHLTDESYIIHLRQKLEDIPIIDKTPVSDKTRQDEILYYLKRHKNISKYITIDDDDSPFKDKGQIHLYQPNYKIGFSQKDMSILLKSREVIR